MASLAWPPPRQSHHANGADTTATLSVSLSLYNVFQSLLALLGLAGRRDE